MAGLLLSQDTTQLGSAPSVSFAMVAALGDNGDGENTGLDSGVADAIRWCQFEFHADIALSLGGSEESDCSEVVLLLPPARPRMLASMWLQARGDGLDDDEDVRFPRWRWLAYFGWCDRS